MAAPITQSAVDLIVERVEKLLDPMAAGLTAGWTRYREMEAEWWADYCKWKTDADRRARELLEPHVFPYEHGGLAVTAATMRKLERGKVRETKPNGKRDQFKHTLEQFPVWLNGPGRPPSPGETQAKQLSRLPLADRQAIAAARLLQLVCRQRGFNCTLGPAICEAVMTAGDCEPSDAAEWLKWFEPPVESAVQASSPAKIKKSPKISLPRQWPVLEAYSVADHLCTCSVQNPRNC